MVRTEATFAVLERAATEDTDDGSEPPPVDTNTVLIPLPENYKEASKWRALW